MRYAATAQVRSLVGCKGSSQPGRERESERGGMSTYSEKGLPRLGHYECTTRMTGLAKASEYRRRQDQEEGGGKQTYTHLIIQSSYLDVMKCYEKPFSSHTNQPNQTEIEMKKNKTASVRFMSSTESCAEWSILPRSHFPFPAVFPLTPIDVCINGTYFKVNGGCFTWALRLDISIWVASRPDSRSGSCRIKAGK